MEITISGGGIDWEAIAALATLVATVAAVVTSFIALTEHRAAESRAERQFRAQVLPILQVEDVVVNPLDPDSMPLITVANAGFGPARGVQIDVWFAAFNEPIATADFTAMNAEIDAHPGTYPTRKALLGTIAAGAIRTIDLGGDGLRLRMPDDSQVIARWKGHCFSTLTEKHEASGALAVHMPDGRVLTSQTMQAMRDQVQPPAAG